MSAMRAAATKLSLMRSSSMSSLDQLTEAHKSSQDPLQQLKAHMRPIGKVLAKPRYFRPDFFKPEQKVLPPWPSTPLGSLILPNQPSFKNSFPISSTILGLDEVQSTNDIRNVSKGPSSPVDDTPSGIGSPLQRPNPRIRGLLGSAIIPKREEPEFQTFTVVLGKLNSRIKRSTVISTIQNELIEGKSSLNTTSTVKPFRVPQSLCEIPEKPVSKAHLQPILKNLKKSKIQHIGSSSTTSLSPAKKVHFSKYLLFIKELDKVN